MNSIKKNSILAILLMVSSFGISETMEDGVSEFNKENYAKAVEILLPYAQAGNPEAQADVGAMYKDGGAGLERDIEASAAWFQKAADQGNLFAQYLLGNMYLNGDGVDTDLEKAEILLVSAAKQGDPDMQTTLAVQYDSGTKLEKNVSEAIHWYKECAKNGSEFCQCYLGLKYKSGYLGVPQDDFESVKWYRMAAEAGSSFAQMALGEAYASGQGAPKNLLTAHMWLNLASASGDASAFTSRRILERKMTQAQIIQSQKMAKNFKPKKATKAK